MDRAFLHDGETLLANLHASKTNLVTQMLRGLIEGLIAGGILAGVVAVIMAASGPGASWGISIALIIIGVVLVLVRRYRLWKHASFRVTTERILIEHHTSLFSSHGLHTVKWNQYQESFLGHRSMFDLFFRVRPVCIRYGTADARFEVCFPSLPFAQDFKHYLDKVDSAVRKQQESTLRPFVMKKRGERNAPEADAGAPPHTPPTPEHPPHHPAAGPTPN